MPHALGHFSMVRSMGIPLLLIACCTATAVAAQGMSPVRSFFKDVDEDGDGQLQQHELQHFVGNRIRGSEAQTKQQIQEAVLQSIGRLDGSDAGSTISEAELESFLHTVLQGTPVADWVAHGLGLPQYAADFQANAVNALDFPLLIQDRGHMLQHLLGVDNPLHRARLLRAMQRQMLGMGYPPGAVPDIQCSRGAHNSLSITWLTPSQPGKPPFHKYVLERLPLSAPGASWEFVGDAVDVTRWLDLPSPGVYQYRVTAWNVYGRGPAATSAACAVSTADVGAGGVDTESLEGNCAVADGRGSCHVSALSQPHWSARSSLPMDCHTSPAPQQLQYPAEGVARQGHPSAAGAQQQGGVYSDQLGSPAAVAAAAHIAAMRQGSPAQSSPRDGALGMLKALVKKASWWLWTASNTVLVLVLPACVRLLPVSVLHRVHHVAVVVLARMLLLLGWLVPSLKPRESAAAAAHGAANIAAGDGHKRQAAPGMHSTPAMPPLGRRLAAAAVTGIEIEPAAAAAASGPGSGDACAGAPNSTEQHPAVQQQHSRAASSSSSSRNDEGGVLPAPMTEHSSAGAGLGMGEVWLLQEGGAPVLPLQPLAPWDGPPSAALAGAAHTWTERAMVVEARPGLDGLPLSVAAASVGGGRAAGRVRQPIVGDSGSKPWAQSGAASGGPLLPHSRSGGSLSARLHGDADLDGRHQWRGVSVVEAAVAATAAGGRPAYLGSSASAPQLQLLLPAQEAPALGSHGKKQCAHPGCEQRFDSLRHLGAKRQRHNCGRCLRTVCLAHTAYSTHGSSGPCGVQSRCVCVACFAQFTPEYQMLLTARNTLPVGAGGVAAGGQVCSGQQRRPSSSGSSVARLLGRSPSSGRMHAATGGAGADVMAAPGCSDSGREEMHGLIGGLGRGASGLPPVVGGSRGRLMWARTWTKLHAVAQFNRAARSSQQQEPQ